MKIPLKFTKNNPKIMNAWAFYDWANSVYSLVIVSAIFPIFWSAITLNKNGTDKVDFLGFHLNNDSLISYITASAFLIVVLISPLLSGIADYVGNKKFFLQFFCYLGSFSCIGMFWFSETTIGYGLFCYFMALIGFWSSLVFYNSYLPDIADPHLHDKLSAKGFSLGYLGSVLLLIINLLMVLSQETDAEKLKMMQYSFVTVGIWWVGFSQYSYKHLPNFKNTNKVTMLVVFKGYKELQFIWKQLNANKPLKYYLTAFFVYSMAVQTIMLIATYFGVEEIQWKDTDATIGLIVSILLIQLIAILGALLTSRLAEKIGNIKTLIIINAIWLSICLYAYTIHTPIEFYITASLVGLVMGGIQSLSRSTYSKLLPQNTKDSTSYFSFFDVAEKVGIVIGMILYGVLGQLTGSARLSITFFAVFFLIGGGLLFRLLKK